MEAVIMVVFPPLIGAIIAGLFSKRIGKIGAHSLTIIAVAISFLASLYLLYELSFGYINSFEYPLYTWLETSKWQLGIGFWVDSLSILMACVVSFVSLMVHIYTIGYMHDDPGYQRFFSYIALFTFAMLMLVFSNNFLQLFFGWEAVGVISYLLIGFWHDKESAVFANLKAFLVNRLGDFGFLIGIAAILTLFGSLDYSVVFNKINNLTIANPSLNWSWPFSMLDLACLGLFIGAMGKSAQVPLHVWLPDSMEGPTPISALIHAATMVTAGVFMVARMSPLFEHSEIILNMILIIGAVTCFFMGLLGIVQNDIKRIIAYSTLSQLGYMVTALGASAYVASIFHLMTHAFFKALLFLGAGAVIIAMHHEQDIRKMGNLRKYMPITYFTMLIGSLALIGFPGLSGFYSKDLIIEAVKHSQLPAAKLAYMAVLSSVFITALYSFRLLFVVFHTQERMTHHMQTHLHEPSPVIWGPLVALSIPSIFIGALTLKPLVTGFLSPAIVVMPNHDTVSMLLPIAQSPWQMLLHGIVSLPSMLALFGLGTAYYFYIVFPKLPGLFRDKFILIYNVFIHKYGFDSFNQTILAPMIRSIGWIFWRIGDRFFIDGLCVNGSAYSIKYFAQLLRKSQSGYLYHYAFIMIIGLILLMFYIIK